MVLSEWMYDEEPKGSALGINQLPIGGLDGRFLEKGTSIHSEAGGLTLNVMTLALAVLSFWGWLL